MKNGKPRVFAYGKIPFNYGAIPQTWESPHHKHAETGLAGDNDPVDVVEISPAPIPEGSVVPIKILGALAMIDEGEIDWKVVAVQATSPLADLIGDMPDVENVLPGVESSVREWFRNYKTADGKPQNKFAYDEKYINKARAAEVIADTHRMWMDLVKGKADKGKLWVKAA